MFGIQMITCSQKTGEMHEIMLLTAKRLKEHF